jgi:hypothetical protein
MAVRRSHCMQPYASRMQRFRMQALPSGMQVQCIDGQINRFNGWLEPVAVQRAVDQCLKCSAKAL